MSRLIEHAQHDLLEGEDYLDNPSLRRSFFDAAILVGPQGWPRLSLALECLKIEERGLRFGSAALIILGGGDDVHTEYDRVCYGLSNKGTKVDTFLVGGDILFSEDALLNYAATYILNILLVQGRREVALSGEKGSLLKVVIFLRDLIIKDHDRYGQIHLYAVPLPQEVE